MKEDWAKEFIANYFALMIILIKKSRLKAELALNSLDKKKNVFKLERFDEFMKYPNEFIDLKSDLNNLKVSLKEKDKETEK